MKRTFSLPAAGLLVCMQLGAVGQPNSRLIKPLIDATILNLKQYTMQLPADGSPFSVFAGTKYDPYGPMMVYTEPHFMQMGGNGNIMNNVVYDIDPNSNLNIQYKTVDMAAGSAGDGSNNYYITCLGQPFNPTAIYLGQPLPVITPPGEANRIAILTVGDVGNIKQPTVEIKNLDLGVPDPYTGYSVFPVSSLYVPADKYLYICGYIMSDAQYTVPPLPPGVGFQQPNFYSPKKAFVICVDVDDNNVPYGQVLNFRVFDTPIDPNIEEYWRKDYDIAMRMKEIKAGAHPGRIFVTGSVNAQTGGTPGTNIVRSGTMNMVIEPLTLNLVKDDNVIAPGNGDGGGENEYGIDMIENPSAPYNKYILSNKFNENVEQHDYMDDGLDAVPYSMGITEVDGNFDLAPPFRYFSHDFNGWGLQLMESHFFPPLGNLSFTIAGMVNNDGQYSDIAPFLLDVHVDDFSIWGSGNGIVDNGLGRKYNTDNGTGDPFSVYNSYYGMGMGLSNIAYHSKFAGRGAAGNIVMMVPRWDNNNRLMLKYMRTTAPANFAINANCGMEPLAPNFDPEEMQSPITIVDGPVDFSQQFLGVSSRSLQLTNVACGSDGYRPAGIEEAVSGKVSLYPNPGGDVVHISGVAEGQYTIKDIAGRTLQGGKLAATKAVNVEKLPAGMYLFHLDVNGKQEVLKFSKQ